MCNSRVCVCVCVVVYVRVCVSVVCMYGCVCVYACGVWSCAKMPDTRKCGEGRSLRDRLLHVPKRTAQTIMRTDGLRVAFGGYARAHCVCVYHLNRCKTSMICRGAAAHLPMLPNEATEDAADGFMDA